jgi:hypothetical protein
MEKVICAAVRASNGKVVRGDRHHDAIRTLQGMLGYESEQPSGDNQGFVTSADRFVYYADRPPFEEILAEIGKWVNKL